MAFGRGFSTFASDDNVSYTAGGAGLGGGDSDVGMEAQPRGICKSDGTFVRRRVDDVCFFYRDGSGVVSAEQDRQSYFRDRGGQPDYADSIKRRLPRRSDVRGAVDEFDDAAAGSVDEAETVGRTCREVVSG